MTANSIKKKTERMAQIVRQTDIMKDTNYDKFLSIEMLDVDKVLIDCL